MVQNIAVQEQQEDVGVPTVLVSPELHIIINLGIYNTAQYMGRVAGIYM